MTIAQPFMAGSSVHQMSKSREGRQKNSFVPGGTLDDGGHRVPAMNGWAIFRGSGATPKTATGTVALPSQVPAGRPMAVWRGRTGQTAFEIVSREGREGGGVAERRNDNSPAIHGWVRRQSNEKSREGWQKNSFVPGGTGDVSET
jgi:hypothetical protein